MMTALVRVRAEEVRSRCRGVAIILVLLAGHRTTSTTTAAPASSSDELTASPVAAYRRAVLADPGDDPGRGRRLFEDVARTRCLACHAINGQGAKLGPDLLGVGGRMTPAEILGSILDPSEKIHPDYASTTIATTAGQVLVGLVRPINDAEVEVATSATDTVRLRLDAIDEQAASPVSLMPSGLEQSMTPAEMADLIAYLHRLEAPRSSGDSRQANDVREIPRAIRPVDFVPIHPKATRFDHAVWFSPIPGQTGRFAVAEIQSGRIWRLQPDATGSEKTLFADLAGEILSGELTGLMGLAFHPDFARNHRYFVKIHGPRESGRLAVAIVERRATDDNLSDSGQPSRLILKIPVVSEIHNGGQVAFGPDGLLYVGMGDTGPQGDPRGHGQDLGQWLGKMLRIDVDRTDGDRPYAIPLDNPFREQPGARPEIFASGFREPWRFSFDARTGELWVGDVGQNRIEEVSVVRKGDNLGWNVLEGLENHSDQFRSAAAHYVPPVFSYSHRVGVSVTGGFVYHGSLNPSLAGKYIFGDYETRWVWAVGFVDRELTSVVEIGRAPDKIVSFGADDAGEIYLVGYDRGMVYRIDASRADLAATRTVEVVPTARTSASSWRYTLGRPAALNWTEPDFDDSHWTAAPGGFGRSGTPDAVVRTEWTSGDIWLRREFSLPDLIPSTMALAVHHDEDAEVYLNGVLAATLPGFTGAYDDAVPIQAAALATLRPGRNRLAVHCRQTQGGQYIDAGIVAAETR